MPFYVADRASDRNNNFNLIRMFAAIGVLISHSWPIALGAGTAEPLSGLLPGMTLGEVSVLVFFCISGFFIARSFANRSSLGAFLMARILRLFPALVVVLVLTVLVAGLWLSTAPPSQFWAATPGYILHNLSLFFLQYDLPGVFSGNPYGPAINGSLWTLNYEVLCYGGVVLAGVAGLLARPALFGLALVGFLGLFAMAEVLDMPGRVETLLRLAFPFAVGMSFWVWRTHIRLSGWLALIFLAASMLIRGTEWFFPVFTTALSYAVFVAGYARVPMLLHYNRIGDYSYGTYIYAFPVQQLVAYHGILSPEANIALALPVTLFCAILSWHWVEAPMLKLKLTGQGGRAGHPRPTRRI